MMQLELLIEGESKRSSKTPNPLGNTVKRFIVCVVLGFGNGHLVGHVAFAGWSDL